MAWLVDRPNGHRWVQFADAEQRQFTIRLGDATKTIALTVKRIVEKILVARFSSVEVAPEIAQWLGEQSDALHAKFAQVGLVAPRQASGRTTLKAWIESYIESRIDAKPATVLNWRQARDQLCAHFGDDRDIATITEADAEDYKLFLLKKKLAATTIQRHLRYAGRFFKSAKKRKLIAGNPFEETSHSGASPDKMHFVTREDTQAILDACPDHHWRTIVALARYGGLRCPSEVLSLRWCDVDVDRRRITVQSPKTEHHAGKGSRVIPLFPELAEHLDKSYELAPEGGPGSIYVVDERFRDAAMGPGGWANANLRTTFQKIVRRAGLDAWPRLFHNLRSSRQTELEDSGFSTKVVCAWLGNSPKIAHKHYLQVTEEHFARALAGNVNRTEAKVKTKGTGAFSGGQAVSAGSQNPRKPRENRIPRGFSTGKVVRGGVEPPTHGFSVHCSTN